MPKLAINGGTPVRTRPFAPYNPFGEADRRAALEVIDSGQLSGFVGSACDEFLGGPHVRRLEEAWASAFKVKHAVSSNSATSSLISALAACKVGPGDEVIVSPFTMSATISSILFNHAVPVFVDVEPESFNLDPDKVEAYVTPRTKAIMVVHLFGHPARMSAIMDIAHRHRLRVIEDTAQSICATTDGQYVGTIGDIGVFSLNRHKLIQSGEGGVAVTNDDELALRMQLVRNHGENVAAAYGLSDLSHTLGYNFRMTELDAAVAYQQFIRREEIIKNIVSMAERLDHEIGSLPGLSAVKVRQNCTHTRMHHTLLYDSKVTGVPLDVFIKALNLEGIPAWGGYLTPQYMLPLFREKKVFGETGCPLLCPHYKGQLQNYGPGLCPVAEELNTLMINHDLHRPPNTPDDMRDVAVAFSKVIENIGELRA